MNIKLLKIYVCTDLQILIVLTIGGLGLSTGDIGISYLVSASILFPFQVTVIPYVSMRFFVYFFTTSIIILKFRSLVLKFSTLFFQSFALAWIFKIFLSLYYGVKEFKQKITDDSFSATLSDQSRMGMWVCDVMYFIWDANSATGVQFLASAKYHVILSLGSLTSEVTFLYSAPNKLNLLFHKTVTICLSVKLPLC